MAKEATLHNSRGQDSFISEKWVLESQSTQEDDCGPLGEKVMLELKVLWELGIGQPASPTTGHIIRKVLDFTPWSFPSSLNTLLPKFFSGPLPTSAPKPTDWGSHVQPWLSFPEPLSPSAYWQPAPSIPGTLFWQTSSTFPSKSHMTIQSHGILLNAPFFSPFFGVCDPNHNFPPFLWLTLVSFTDSSALRKKCWSVSGLSSWSYSSVIPGSRGLWVCTTSALMAHMGKYTQPPWDISPTGILSQP